MMMYFGKVLRVGILLILVNPPSIVGVVIGELPNEQHDVSGTFQILSSKKIFIQRFNYDGGGPGAWFYYFPPGVPVDYDGRGGRKIPLSRKYGRSDGRLKRRRYVNMDVEVALPKGITTCDVGTFIIWCEPFGAIFTRMKVPRNIFENHASGPCKVKTDAVVTPPPAEFDNCIPFDSKLQLSWKVNDDQSSVRFKLCGCQSTEPSTNQYMGFGLSGSKSMTQMYGADATITWVDEIQGPQAVDYYLTGYTQCRAGVGACPDELDSSNGCTNDVFDVQGYVSNGIQCVSFHRPFTTADTTCDQTIDPSNSNQYIVWAIGGLGATAFKHFLNAKHDQSPIHLGRPPRDQCENTDLVCASCTPFQNKRIVARKDTTFLVRIGPSGNERGYQGITGRAGWGISFHVNATLIPELVVERGNVYTFLIQGGDNPSDLSKYHPFYITSSIGGGRLQNTQEERDAETVYAGFDNYGQPTAVGQLCQLSESLASETTRESCNTLQAYLDTLVVPSSCDTAQPGRLVWSPDENTPNLVYYQCGTHLNLGWRIVVLNRGERYDSSSTSSGNYQQNGYNGGQNGYNGGRNRYSGGQNGYSGGRNGYSGGQKKDYYNNREYNQQKQQGRSRGRISNLYYYFRNGYSYGGKDRSPAGSSSFGTTSSVVLTIIMIICLVIIDYIISN